MTTPVPPSPHRPRDFADLARRISGRTTDLFAIALVVALLLTVGVQLTRWWRTEPPTLTEESVASEPMSLWDHADGVAVSFDSDDWTLERTTAFGTAGAITDSIVNSLRQQLDALLDGELPPIDPAESAWLKKLDSWTPLVETGNGGKVYTLGGPWPWIVATHAPSITPDSHAAGEGRVLCWAFALPQSDSSWTVYSARRSSRHVSTTSHVNIPLPDDMQPLLTAATSTGGLKAFRSASSLKTAQSDWHRLLSSSGWVQHGEWMLNDALARGTFQQDGVNQTTTLNATLIPTDDGETRGIVEWRTDRTDTRPSDTRHQTTPP
ncbi:MAG: hypothetical protein JNG89_04075 [Planctomycetaceae bacterium]|nr:hypothetical protein [Planctomycetaceae bacterium]